MGREVLKARGRVTHLWFGICVHLVGLGLWNGTTLPAASPDDLAFSRRSPDSKSTFVISFGGCVVRRQEHDDLVSD